ncbi:IS91 family transposase, partial [Petrocella sp. FN5]|uniref:IS91 family transposase n=1 Tax=Petrocella sp. FN5 TaxID=3032002 RepID=UPI0023DA29E0
LVPAGGLSEDETHFIEPKQDRYFIPVQVVSALFKKKFLALWVDAVESGRIKFIGNTSYLKEPKTFRKLKNELYKKGWVAHIRPPFSTGEVVIEYLSRYIKRVAISNERIIAADGENVSIKWKDYRDGKTKIMTLTLDEFIRRFLLHILPDRYVKVRYYGFLSNGQRKKKLVKCRKILRFRVKKQESSDNTMEEENRSSKCICPQCRIFKRKFIKSPVLAKDITGKARERP